MSLPDRFPYQEYQFQKIIGRKRTAVIGRPGCGKTRPIIDAMVELGLITHEPEIAFPKGPIFVMCSGPAVATWLRQFPEWVGDPRLREHIHVITGDEYKGKAARVEAWLGVKKDPGIYITNFSCFRLDFEVIRRIRWAAQIADEYHKTMRRRQSATFKRFRSWTRHSEIMVVASGSVVSKDPGSMWTAFTLIDPKLPLFRSYWRYLSTFCHIEEGAYGREVIGLRNVGALQEIMDKYMAYVPADVIADQQPDGRRQVVDAQMTKEQARIYNELSEEMIAEINDGDDLLVASTPMGKFLMLRQLLCCPRILDPSLGMGGGYELILDKLEEQPHAIVFVPFRLGVKYVTEALCDQGYRAEGMMGGVKHDEQSEILDRFRRHRGILVCTIAYAESFDCETCDTSYFLGFDFNVDPNQQAEGRTQRAISEHKFVTWNYVRYMGTYDEIMLMNLNQDMNNVSRVLSRPKELIAALKGEVLN